MNARYGRQIPIVGAEGMERIRGTTVGVVGCGGLGTTLATSLAAAGIGGLVLIDGDRPEITDLNRQFAYREGTTSSKAHELSRWLSSVNPQVAVEAHAEHLDAGNTGLLSGCDILADCLDNMRSRKLLNRFAVDSGKPLVHAGVSHLHGQVTVVIPGRTPCLECLFGDTDDEDASISAAVMLIASAEAMEVLKLAAGTGEPLAGRILTVNLGGNAFEVTEVRRDPSCAVCGHLRDR